MKKKKIKIVRNGETIFEKKLIDLPIKEEFIIRKSIELFDDEDPCIIHQSYVVKEYADSVLNIFKMNGTNFILGKHYVNELEFLNYTDIDALTFELLG